MAAGQLGEGQSRSPLADPPAHGQAGAAPAAGSAAAPATPQPAPARGAAKAAKAALRAPLSLPAWVLDESCWVGGLAGGQRFAQYSADRDVVLRMEVISSVQVRS